ncbi:MAG: hypothetical protein EKK59_06105 [Neisseriaceae bacterium]|jgi:poly(hydroxyalkanoate) granule-associated protein|nr:hypothetical protein [Pseudomonadota bacterium]RTK99372.1 MAG: hypothetical protein EKK59_06105 [Neisseriaceae bacterium]
MVVVEKIKSIASNVADNKLAQNAKDTAQQVWWAGLGAVARVQEGGNKVFAELVKEGEAVHQRTRKTIEDNVSKGSSVASDKWGKVEKVFEERVAKTLNKIGVPSRDQVEELNKRVAELSKLVKKLAEQEQA